jgi:hypothetical protein
MDARMGDNINGPSLVCAPSWVGQNLGRFYLYFGHHNGKYIRLAYADDLQGEWRTHEPGVLDLEDTYFTSHIASPDALVDEARQEVRLYFHGKLTPADFEAAALHGHDAPQGTRVALSRDGLHFEVLPEMLGVPYFRVFQWDGWTYAFGMPGIVYRSRDGLTGFERGHNPFTHISPDMRHCAVLRRGHALHFFYTTRGDCPEHILATTLDLREGWTGWHASEPVSILKPELPWEGANEPLVPSDPGVVRVPVNQLRDPAIFKEGERIYLLYTVAGEQGIAIAELTDS